MKHIWSVLCQRSSIDVESNLLSLFSCVEELSLTLDSTEALKKNIVVPTEFQLVSFWAREKAEEESSLEVEGELLDAQGKVLNKFNNSFPVKKGVLRFRNRTNIQGLPITGPGRYLLRLKQKDKEGNWLVVTELPLDIKINYKLMDVTKK
jgi:hypothetical protein